MIRLSQLITQFLPALRERYGARLLPSHLHALAVMALCRCHANPVVWIMLCLVCGHRARIPCSCGHRSCPHCQHDESQQWLERQRAKLLPTTYFMVTFTLPPPLRDFAFHHQKLAYDLLMRLGWQTLATFAQNDKQLQGKLGATAVLHTHARNLDYHPHVHFIVPAGAIDTQQRVWRTKRGRYLFRQKSLAKVFRAKWFDALKKTGLRIPETLPKNWVVDCKWVGSGDPALTYLGQYLYRGVLRERDIIHCCDDQVTFRYTTNKGQRKTRTLPGEDFLWLLMQHVLPRGFRRARDYGFLHPNSKSMIQLIQLLFSTAPPAPPPPTSEANCPLCPVCGALDVIFIRHQDRAKALPT